MGIPSVFPAATGNHRSLGPGPEIDNFSTPTGLTLLLKSYRRTALPSGRGLHHLSGKRRGYFQSFRLR